MTMIDVWAVVDAQGEVACGYTDLNSGVSYHVILNLDGEPRNRLLITPPITSQQGDDRWFAPYSKPVDQSNIRDVRGLMAAVKRDGLIERARQKRHLAERAANGRGKNPVFIGFQICSPAGVNIQGDDGDPTGQLSFEVFAPKAVAAVAAVHPDYLWMPIFEGDIQKPSIIG